MKIIRDSTQMYFIVKRTKLKGKNVGFVPTMGALHEGHISLIKEARRENDIVVVSIFVNPIQFGPKEDFRRYPRPINKDILLCRKEGVDFIFYPAASQLYPKDFSTYVVVDKLSGALCGKYRLGHFKGVATIVSKLFNIVSPDAAYFGQKDAQQAAVIKRMVCDLNIPVKIKVLPTVREKSGLALSSRNIYLNEREKNDALVLFQSLNLAKSLIGKGIRDADKIINIVRQLIQKKDTAKIDYIDIVDIDILERVKKITGNCLIVLAVWIGRTRLIDNIIINSKHKIPALPAGKCTK